MMSLNICTRRAGIVLMALLSWTIRAKAQTKVGEDWLLNMTGSLSTGYGAGNTNEGPSSHGITFGGNGVLNGSFYSPSFLSFSVAPFSNESRNNSSYQSISNSTGVTTNATIFGGSHFPGYFNFSKVYNGEGNYSLPGTASYKTNGNTQTLGLGWSANVPDRPTLTVGYQQGSSDYSVYGASTGNFSNFHSVSAQSAYNVAGIHLSGGVHYSNIASKFPQLAKNEPTIDTHSDSTSYSFNANRNFGNRGNAWTSVTRYNYQYRLPGSSNSMSSDVITAGVALRPAEKLSLQVSGDYDDNLAGTLYQTIAEAGGPVVKTLPGESSHSWGVFGMAQYNLLSGLYVAGTISQRQQLFLGNSYGSTSYSGSANYGHQALGGQFAAGITISQSTLTGRGDSIQGMLSNASYFRRVHAWNFKGSFNYARDVQTFLIAHTTSGYSYSGSASRRFGKLDWNGSASGSKSLLSNALGSDTFSQSYATGLSGRWLGASASYSRSRGNGIFTNSGITPIPPGTPPPINQIPFVFYAGTTYAFGAGSAPVKGLSINASYAKTRSNTLNGTSSSNNLTTQGNVFMQYMFRKMYFAAGYSRLLQGFSATGQPPVWVSSYYAGISRWFNLF